MAFAQDSTAQEVEKVNADESSLTLAEERNMLLAQELAQICHTRRAEDIQVLDMRTVCDFTDAFVLCTVTSGPQMKAVAKEISRHMEGQNVSRLSRTGLDPGAWVVLDYGDVIAHLFNLESRMYYQLEQLWGDAPLVSWEE